MNNFIDEKKLNPYIEKENKPKKIVIQKKESKKNVTYYLKDAVIKKISKIAKKYNLPASETLNQIVENFEE